MNATEILRITNVEFVCMYLSLFLAESKRYGVAIGTDISCPVSEFGGVTLHWTPTGLSKSLSVENRNIKDWQLPPANL